MRAVSSANAPGVIEAAKPSCMYTTILLGIWKAVPACHWLSYPNPSDFTFMSYWASDYKSMQFGL